MLRGIAAVALVFYHTQLLVKRATGVVPFDGVFYPADRGIDLFFVLSGFIIAFVHRGDFARPARVGRYFYRRLTRLFPAVMIVTLIAAAIYAAGFGGAAGKLTLENFFTSLFLLPQPGVPLVNVSWTLKYEFFFYLLFASTIVFGQFGIACLVVWQLATLACVAAGIDTQAHLATFYLRPFCLEFGIGMLVALAALRVVARPGAAVVGIALATGGTLAFLVAGVYAYFTGPPENGIFDVLAFGVPAGALILGCTLLEAHGKLRIHGALVALGGASYAIYLVHFSAISVAIAVASRLRLSGYLVAGAALLAVFGVAMGLLFHRYIDAPMQAWFSAQRSSRVHVEAAS